MTVGTGATSELTLGWGQTSPLFLFHTSREPSNENAIIM